MKLMMILLIVTSCMVVGMLAGLFIFNRFVSNKHIDTKGRNGFIEFTPIGGLPEGLQWRLEEGPDFNVFRANDIGDKNSSVGMYFGRHPDFRPPENCKKKDGQVGPFPVIWFIMDSKRNGSLLFNWHTIIAVKLRNIEQNLFLHVWINSTNKLKFEDFLSNLKGVKFESGYVTPPSDLVPFKCSACGKTTNVWKGIPIRLINAQTDLEKANNFKIELDPRQYCEFCREKLSQYENFDLRMFPKNEPIGSSVRLKIHAAGMKKPEKLIIDFNDINLLINTLNGKYDEIYLDTINEHYLSASDVEKKLKKWYQRFYKKISTMPIKSKFPTVQPKVLDFGTVKFDQPVKKVLRLINPDKREMIFSFHGVIAFSEAERSHYNLHLPEEFINKFNYQYAFTKEDIKKTWYKKMNKFMVAPESEVEIPIISSFQKKYFDRECNYMDIQVSVYDYQPDNSESSFHSRFVVRLIHKDP